MDVAAIRVGSDTISNPLPKRPARRRGAVHSRCADVQRCCSSSGRCARRSVRWRKPRRSRGWRCSGGVAGTLVQIPGAFDTSYTVALFIRAFDTPSSVCKGLKGRLTLCVAFIWYVAAPVRVANPLNTMLPHSSHPPHSRRSARLGHRRRRRTCRRSSR